jgi:large conductance mechanosensitive channel
MLKGFKNFLMRGDVVVVAVGLVVALAFSGLVKAFTDFIINPLISAAGGGKKIGLGVYLTDPHQKATFLDVGSFISAVIYFLIFLAVVYFAIVVPYKMVMARKGTTVFGDPAPMQTCPACLSSDLPVGATKCKYCATDLTAPAAGPTTAAPRPHP